MRQIRVLTSFGPLAQAFVSYLGVCTVIATLGDTDTLAYEVVLLSGVSGRVVSWAMLACALVSALDVLVNQEVQPPRLPRLVRYRHWPGMGMVLGWILLCLMAVPYGSQGLISFYLGFAFFASAFLTIDASRRRAEHAASLAKSA